MRHHSALAASAAAITLALAACSPAADTPAPTPAQEPVAAPAPQQPAPPVTSPRVLALEGLGDLRIGQPVPADSAWAERGAQASDSCRTVTSPDCPGVYAIVSHGKVQRITVGQRSGVKLAEGIGVGATEAEVKQGFAGFREEPHKYSDAPAKYLTAASGDPALRFEIGSDGKVSLIHRRDAGARLCRGL